MKNYGYVGPATEHDNFREEGGPGPGPTEAKWTA